VKPILLSWPTWALLSGVFAALTAIFAKIGIVLVAAFGVIILGKD
jgi:transporter family protein